MKETGDIFDNGLTSLRSKSLKTQRILLKRSGKQSLLNKSGIVVSAVGKNYLVELSEGITIEANRSGSMVHEEESSTLIAIGDYVEVLINKKNDKSKLGTIVEVKERKNLIARIQPSTGQEDIMASNGDYVMIMVSANEPVYNRRLIDRIIVAAEDGYLKPVIAVNKVDLANIRYLYKDFKAYREAGLKVFYLSLRTDHGLKRIMSFLKGKTIILIGPSGAGKSTLINKLSGSDVQRVSEISERTGKGTHTTTSARIVNFEGGSKIIDTPGIREFGLYKILKEELPFFFHDFDRYRHDCRFMSCTHTHEPDCRVKEAAESGRLDLERYESYLNIYYSLEE